jgi:hypothetical protein
MHRFSAVVLLVCALAGQALAYPINSQMTVYRVVQKVPHSVGALVEWRGMASQVKATNFVLRAGPYKIAVRNGLLRFHIRNGDPIRVTGRVKQAGASPVLEPLTVVPIRIRETKDAPFDPTRVSPQEGRQVEHWYAWICSFNRRLAPETAGRYVACVFQYSRHYQIDPRLVLSIVAAESGFEKDAVSVVGAIGLGQLMPGTALQMGVANPRDPFQNLLGCTRYLWTEMRRWQGRPDKLERVIASYNAGAGAVQQYNGVPPYPETRAYVLYVTSLYRELRSL